MTGAIKNGSISLSRFFKNMAMIWKNLVHFSKNLVLEFEKDQANFLFDKSIIHNFSD
jgi:hypothetical protein